MKYKEYEIDLSKLARNYSVEPLKVTNNGVHSESLTFDELNYLCNDICMKSEHICSFLGIKQHKLSHMQKSLNVIKKHITRNKHPKSEKILQKFREARLKRFPLNDVKKFYFDENMSIQQLANIYHTNKNIMNKYLLENGIKKSKEQVVQGRKNTNMKVYGCTVPTQNSTIHQKTLKTLMEKYGVSNISQIKGSREKAANTMLERYGVSNYTHSKDYKLKTEQTCLQKYGTTHHMKSSEFLKKYDQKIYKKYGVKRFTQTPEYKTKLEQTCLQKYNYPTYLQSEDYKTKTHNTVREKYGVEWITQAPEIIKKKNETIKNKYNRINPGQINISDESLAILENKEQLSKIYQKIGTFQGVGKFLNIGDTTVARYVRLHNIPVITERCRSVNEENLLQYITSLYTDTILTNDRSILDGLELDIVLPKLKLAFEFNGMYWHSTIFKPSNYHFEKSQKCQEKGYHLIHVYEPEWIQNQEKIKLFVKNLLCTKQLIGARETEFKEISNHDANQFYEENHLQGKSNNNKSFGLFYNNELISAISFTKPGENKKEKCDYIINRFCVKDGFTVSGGFSKLLKHSNIHGNIRTYQMIDKFEGKIYEKSGFKRLHHNKMYYWCKNNEWLPRSKTNKRALGITENISESKWLEQHGYIKIYTAGTYTWEIKL